jgi:hypothetical protein
VTALPPDPNDRRLDLTDVFIFKSAEDSGKTVLIIDSELGTYRRAETPGECAGSESFR